MRARPGGLRPIPFRLFENPEMRFYLRNQNIAAVYKLLGSYGISQRQIAAHTGQSQSEISEILAGRQVYAHHVLVRICEGFGIPHGWMGLAFDDTPPRVVDKPSEEVEQAVGEALNAIERIAQHLRIDLRLQRGATRRATPEPSASALHQSPRSEESN